MRIAEKLISHIYPYTNIPALYDAMYLEIFGSPDPMHVPATVLIGEKDGQIVGMMGIYVHDKNTVYIQASGFLPGQQNKPMNLIWLNQAIDFLHGTVDHIMASIFSANTQALRLVLKAGFEIIGTHTVPNGTLLVDIRHSKEK